MPPLSHCTAGIGIWDWASTDEGAEPDVVMACCGDIPTLETLAAVDLLRRRLPDLKIRVVNVVDLMTLQPASEHPHGLSDRDFDAIFTADKPIVFAFHGYPWLIHRLTYRRTNHDNLHVRGYKEEGTTTTPFDMTVLNDLDRFHLAGDVIDRVPRLRGVAGREKQFLRNRLIEHKLYISRYGDDMPEIRDWHWPAQVKILVLNGGSSSFKCWFRDVPCDGPFPWTAHLQWRARLRTRAPASLDTAAQGGVHPKIDVVGHRIVHGGAEISRTASLITPEVRAAIAEQEEFAPAHNRLELEAVETVDRVYRHRKYRRSRYSTPAFHATLEPAAYVYPGPYAWLEQGVRRYGFHGINVQYCCEARRGNSAGSQSGFAPG